MNKCKCAFYPGVSLAPLYPIVFRNLLFETCTEIMGNNNDQEHRQNGNRVNETKTQLN